MLTTNDELEPEDPFVTFNPITSTDAINWQSPEGRLIGFKAIVGANQAGTYENIRQIAVITDTNNCEEARWSGFGSIVKGMWLNYGNDSDYTKSKLHIAYNSKYT